MAQNGLIRGDPAANAPEVDPAALAPQYREDDGAPEVNINRGDNSAPEVTPKSGLQTAYDRSLPEAIPTSSENSFEKSESDDAKADPDSRRKLDSRRRLALLIFLLVAVALGVGLGVGLTRRNKNNASQESVPDSATTSTNTTSASPGGQANVTASIQQTKHAIMNDTSIAAVTLPNLDRRVFFQEASGIVRLAMYSEKGQAWASETTTDFQVVTNAKNNTPLAAVYWPNGSSVHTNDTWILFYVTADQNTLSCVSWDGGRPSKYICDPMYLLDSSFPTTPVNPDSRHLSAALISADYADGMLLVYEDISKVVNIMWRSIGGGAGDHGAKWHNLTSQFLSSASEQLETTATRGTMQFTGTCSPSMSTVGRWLYCFTRNGTASSTLGIIGLEFYRPLPTSSGLEGENGMGGMSSTIIGPISGRFQNVSQTDITILEGGQAMWINDTNLQGDPGPGFELDSMPVPKSPFPYRRMGSAVLANGTQTFVYHQLNGSVFAEEFWNGTGFWEGSRNVSVEVA